MKISPIIGVMRFDKSGMLSARNVGSYEALRRVGEVVYWFALLPNMIGVDVFHISIFKK